MKTIYLTLSRYSNIIRPSIHLTVLVNHDHKKSKRNISNISLALRQKHLKIKSLVLYFDVTFYDSMLPHYELQIEKRIAQPRSK